MRGFVHNLVQRFTAVLCCALIAAQPIVAAAQSEQDLPDIGNPAGTLINKDDSYMIGLMVLRELRDQNEVLDDPEATEYIQSVGSRLAAQAPEQGHPISYYVIKETDINAFAIGNLVCVNVGTILASDNESQLAGVMAHETAHITQRHLARGIQAQSRQTMAAAAAMLAAILLGVAGGGGQVIEGGIAAAQGLAAQQQINFTRGDEFEADRVGMQFLARAGFSPSGIADFFETFSRRYGYELGLIPKFLQDHPVSSERIAEARNRAAHLEQPKNLKDSVSYSLVRERLRVLTADETYDIVGYYRKHLESDNATLADRYGEAVALTRRHDPAEAVDMLKPLVQQHQSVILLRSALGEAQLAAGRPEAALATFAEGERLFPRNVPLSVHYADALIRTGHPKEAHELLLDLFNNTEPTPAQIQLTAQAANAAGNPGDAYYYMGEYHISNGNLPMASHQLELALATPNLTNVQRERYRARLDEIRDFLASERRAQRTADDGNRGGGRERAESDSQLPGRADSQFPQRADSRLPQRAGSQFPERWGSQLP